MATLCNDMYDTFDDKQIEYYYPYTFHKDDLDYLDPDKLNKKLKKVQIPLGDTQLIEIDLTGVVEDSSLLENSETYIYIYNFRYELIWGNSYPTETVVRFPITKELTETCFTTRGLYLMSIKIIKNDDEATLILPYDFVIEII